MLGAKSTPSGTAVQSTYSGAYFPGKTPTTAAERKQAAIEAAAAKALIKVEGWFHLAGHYVAPGTDAAFPAGGFRLGDEVLTPEQLVELLPRLSGWDPASPKVILTSCAAGKRFDGQLRSGAEQLRDALARSGYPGGEVVAGTETVVQFTDRTVKSGDYVIDANGVPHLVTESAEGKYLHFGPGEGGRDRVRPGPARDHGGGGRGRGSHL